MKILEKLDSQFKLLNESEKPFRNRVEVYAVKDNKLYCGKYKDGSLGVFGGGTDGEALEEAAAREFEEETGYKVKNLKKVPVDPIEVIWKDAKSEKQKKRMEDYKGTRTWFYYGEFDDSDKKDKASGDDGKHNLTDVGLKELNDELIKSTISDTEDDGIAKQQQTREKVLKYIINDK
jgi:8-oxo-dGTP pyrophosphatase MutT (NUDIX family)